MTVELAIIIIITVAIVLVLLFYLVTRYFNYRLQKSLDNQNYEFSMVEGIQLRRDEIEEPDSENFADNFFDEWRNNKRQQGQQKVFMQLAEISGSHSLKQSLNSEDNNSLYGHSRAQRKEMKSIPILQESFRTNTSNKSFGIQKLDSLRSQLVLSQNSFSSKNPMKQTTHKFISQLVSYTSQGISIIYNIVTQIWKPTEQGEIKEKRRLQKEFISRNDENFLETLEAYGFDYGIESAYKFQKTIKIPKIKATIAYSTSQLKSTQGKQEISLQQFHQLRKEIETG